VDWKDRAHFFGVAAQLMRHILVDHARGRRAGKRGGPDQHQISLDGVLCYDYEDPDQLLAVNEALERLAAFDRGRPESSSSGSLSPFPPRKSPRF